MEIDIVKVGQLQTNCYILTIKGNSLIIDPGDDYDAIVNKVGNKNVNAILITHNHSDHIGALKQISNKYKCDVFSYKNLVEGFNSISDFNFKVIYTPGHTSDSISFLFEKEHVIFTGDFIFKDTIGRCDLPTGSFISMLKSLNNISKYKNLTIYPGHGDITELDYEKQHNPYFSIEIE